MTTPTTSPLPIDTLTLAPPPKRGIPVAVTGTWEGARAWLQYAAQFERAKLFSQIMLGFELMAIRQQTPHGNSVKQDQSGNSCQIGTNQKESWDDKLEKELRIPHRSAYRYMEMARAAAPRLRKTLSLHSFDLLKTPVSALPAPQQKLLADTVRKISDGKTQLDFAADLRIYKGLGNAKAGRKPGDGGRPPGPTTPDAWRALHLADYRERRNQVIDALSRDPAYFTLCEDQDLVTEQALQSLLELHLKARRAWFGVPILKRDAPLTAKIEEMLR